MKKTILVLLVVALLLFIIGCKDNSITGGTIVCNKPYILVGMDCCLDKNDNSICDKDEIDVPQIERVEPPKDYTFLDDEVDEAISQNFDEDVAKAEKDSEQTIESNGAISEFKVKEGEIVNFADRIIEIESIGFFQGKLAVKVNVNGIEREIFNTKTPEIINGLKIQTLRYEQLQKAVILKIEKFELGLNEKLITIRNPVFIQGREIRLKDISDNGQLLLDIIYQDNFDLKRTLNEGDTLTSQGITITNVKSYPRSTTGVKIEKYAIIRVSL